MARIGSTMSLSFPRFTGAVKKLVIINAAVFLLMALLRGLAPGIYRSILLFGALVPDSVAHGWIWQLVTYSFIHAGVLHLLFNMLALWMFGSQFESDWGRRQFLEFYFFCVIGAALTTITIGYLGVALFNASPATPFFGTLARIVGTATVGASGGIYGLLIAFGMLHGDREIFMFPLPFTIKARYMVMIWIFLAAAGALQEAGGVASFAHLGGALFGWFYLRFLPRRGLQFATSESYYGIRNRYYKWKRRRAGRKFEVYMNKHKREDYFDEYGNFKDPGGKNRGDDKPRPPWVN
ncbi:MAG TPA: rhomboid family intramembrane serine protease [Clostridia bacterium]|nr:rhomboid family intramembrane serine protease [Clostridia bacterium]